jgi:hypothetical protein
LLARSREHLARRRPKPQRPVADGQHRCADAAAAVISKSAHDSADSWVPNVLRSLGHSLPALCGVAPRWGTVGRCVDWIAHISAVLVYGWLDLSCPPHIAWTLGQAWHTGLAHCSPVSAIGARSSSRSQRRCRRPLVFLDRRDHSSNIIGVQHKRSSPTSRQEIIGYLSSREICWYTA